MHAYQFIHTGVAYLIVQNTAIQVVLNFPGCPVFLANILSRDQLRPEDRRCRSQLCWETSIRRASIVSYLNSEAHSSNDGGISHDAGCRSTRGVTVSDDI